MTIANWKTQPTTAQDLLAFLREEMAGGGVEQARTEARWIVEDVLGCGYSSVLAGLAPNPTSEQSQAALDILNSRLMGKPLAHVLGYTEFYGLRFKVAPGVLVPRPETEMLVETALKILEKENWREPWILDLYTGCGNVLLSIMSEMPMARGAGIDADPVALACAEENREILNCPNAVFAHGNVREVLDKLDQKFHLLTANPPYVATDEISGLDPEVKAESRIALDGGPDGLSELRVLAEKGRGVLAADGLLLCEIGADQAEKVRRTFSDWKYVDIIKDLTGRDRILIAHDRS